MRTEQARPVRLEDYRPPDWLVETVDLDVSLDPTATRVRATLELQAQSEPAARRRRSCSTATDSALVSLKLDGAALAARAAMSRRPTA